MPYFTTSDNCKLYYESEGSGDPIIFIHGWTANRLSFFLQVPEFAKTHQVITYDARGHGSSDRGPVTENNLTIERLATDLHELIDHLGLEKVNVCGWSMGGSTLFHYVRLFGTARLKSIAIIDMTPKLITDADWELGQSKSWTAQDNADFIVTLARSFGDALDQFLPLTFSNYMRNNPEIFPKAYAEKRAFLLKNTPHCMLALWISLSAGDYRKDVENIDVPTFLAYSGDGQLYSPEHGQWMQAHIQNSVLDIFPKGGHGLFLDQADKFNQDYEQFLSTL